MSTKLLSIVEKLVRRLIILLEAFIVRTDYRECFESHMENSGSFFIDTLFFCGWHKCIISK